MDVNTDLVWVTDKLRELFQFSPDEKLSFKRFMEVIHPDDRERVSESVRRSRETGALLNIEYRIVCPGGGIRWIVARGRPYSRGSGLPERLMGVSNDITQRKMTELELSESRTLLAALVDSTLDMIWSVDSEHFGLLTFNRGLYEYFLNQRGIHIEAGMRPEELFPAGEFVQTWHNFYRRALDEGSFTTEYLVYAGTRTLRLNLNRLKRDDVVFGVSVFGQDITERMAMEARLREQLEEIESLKLQLEKENINLREELSQGLGFEKIVGSSDALNYVLFRVGQVAPTDATVLILGETGTGKGMVANAIHGLSGRKDRPMITVNCAALPANLIESELFGREKGAFTGAHARQAGRFEVADKGTIFLDEIGELPLELQSKLLRVLQDGEFERLGSAKTTQGGRQGDRLDEPRPEGGGPRRAVPGGPLLPAQRVPRLDPAAQETPGRHPAARALFHGQVCPQDGQADRHDPEVRNEVPAGLLVARQREGAGARGRTGRDHHNRSRASDCRSSRASHGLR